ncbi:MAG TPA: multicopper oxidase domain-containing protein [Amaricoccus sp.]|uniref:multicopper oxidase family protein n=1 Tax=Amaricoccus sp. TaxID=1872485 RepID=UPI002CE83A4D|nr:multicopper oxidase domain-containing protein [Amaricoccus sp.]HMQ92175.1 multicopper oxidase domain-containing protein [Amaricoccus sp.]HMR36555.1 multicopper oxidase domain-containing protein [Paracoccus sp. (in: a-proteobacteria)]HMR53453.1 multicopper oxidase domain-containing protein [Amaricoccus sp.]HMU00420.1 multicopper oxidase domain-containing protein [Amaricoccus sp.]
MNTLSRRGFLAASAAALAAAHLPRAVMAQAAAPLALSPETRTLDINGRAATVFGLAGPGGQGLVLDAGQRFQVDLTNNLDIGTIIHWHGQIPPNAQDGVPDLPMPMLKPGETRSYDFAPLAGTYWMHSHVPVQEMNLLAAPLIVRSAEDVAADRQEVTLFLHDFAFKTPEEVMAEISGGHGGGHGAGHGAGSGASPMQGMPMGGGMGMMQGMDHGAMGNMPMGDMAGMAGMAMDLNDYDWDAYLANDRTLSDPEVVQVERGGRIRLRVINAAAATVFWIDTGAAQARLVAADGHGVQPLSGTRFGLAMGQRLDLEIDLPNEGGTWPILALREGARERTGLILATPGADIRRIDILAEAEAPAFDTDLAQESRLVALNALPDRPVDRGQILMLGGTMQPYVWTINGAVWGQHRPIAARSGERVVLSFHNMSMMGHPMHLHGHVFQVVRLNGRAVSGALRDTVYVPPMSMVDIALDAGEAARWMLHCHHMPHLETGMMTEFAVSA